MGNMFAGDNLNKMIEGFYDASILFKVSTSPTCCRAGRCIVFANCIVTVNE